MSDITNSPKPGPTLANAYNPEQRLAVVHGVSLGERISEDEQRKLRQWRSRFEQGPRAD